MEKNFKKLLSKYKQIKENNLVLFNVPKEDLREVCGKMYRMEGVYLRSIVATQDSKSTSDYRIYYIFSSPPKNVFFVPFIQLKKNEEFPSLSETIFESSSYEREIHTLFGLVPKGHKNLKPLTLHSNWPKDIYPLSKSRKWNARPKIAGEKKGQIYEFQTIEGEGIYEIPVGPVHAGVIEPGHFRFSVAGEEVVNLEPMLGYTHKGSEKLFEVLPMNKKISLSEHVSGDTSFSHSLAFCQAVETLSSTKVPERALFLRVLFSELERLANHVGDCGFIMGDAGYAFGGSQILRLREVVMQLNESLTGSRFLRGVNTYGGVNIDINKDQAKKITKSLEDLEKDFSETIEICEDDDSVMNRLKRTGILEKQIASDYGVVGIAARASGLPVDVRVDHPYAAYKNLDLKKAVYHDGDVNSRFRVRIAEVHSSINLIMQVLKKLPAGKIKNSKKLVLKKNSFAVSMVEAWRGDVCYFVKTDGEGKIDRVSVRDPSFLNWPAVPYAVVGNIVLDFPLVNKSFNLSYSGHDR